MKSHWPGANQRPVDNRMRSSRGNCWSVWEDLNLKCAGSWGSEGLDHTRRIGWVAWRDVRTELDYIHWPAAQGMLAVPHQRRLIDD